MKCTICNSEFEPKKFYRTLCIRCKGNIARKNGLATKSSPQNISSAHKQVILGTLLGDGCLEIRTNKAKFADYLLSFKHGVRQKNYCAWKHNLLGCLVTSQEPRPVKNGRSVQYRSRTTTHPYFTKLKQAIYQPQKTIQKHIFSELDYLGIAVWYMDDGSLTFDHGLPCVRFSTCSFSQSEILFLRNLLENKFQIKTMHCKWTNPKQNKIYYGILLRNQNAIKFLTKLQQTVDIPQCMTYKFDFKRELYNYLKSSQ